MEKYYAVYREITERVIVKAENKEEAKKLATDYKFVDLEVLKEETVEIEELK